MEIPPPAGQWRRDTFRFDHSVDRKCSGDRSAGTFAEEESMRIRWPLGVVEYAASVLGETDCMAGPLRCYSLGITISSMVALFRCGSVVRRIDTQPRSAKMRKCLDKARQPADDVIIRSLPTSKNETAIFLLGNTVFRKQGSGSLFRAAMFSHYSACANHCL